MSFDLSIVTAVRNDNYGGDFIARLNNFINWNLYLISEVDIRVEIVLVNWNFDPNEIELENRIVLKKQYKNTAIRIVNVPNHIHTQVVEKFTCKNVPVLEYHAKNVGIQRSRGSWILCCNPDILFDPKLLKELKEALSLKNNYFRVNRVDFRSFDKSLDLSENTLRLIKNNSFQINFKGFTQAIASYKSPYVFFAYVKNELMCLWRRNTYRFRIIFKFLNLNVYYYNIDYKYHTNASGDFILMEKNWFLKLKGFPETNYIALHTDSQFVVMCGLSIQEKTYKNPIFHLDHERRYNSQDIHNPLNKEAYYTLQEKVTKMIETKKPICNVHDDWGLKNINLDILTIYEN